MIWTIIILIFVGFVGYVLSIGKISFWKLVGRNPEESYKYFKEHSDVWKVADTHESKFVEKGMRLNKKYKNDWTGPYNLYLPKVGVIDIYGKKDVYEQEQNRLIQFLDQKEKGVFDKKYHESK